jgi:ankyrin repeat protein
LVAVRDRNGDTGLHIASRGGFKAIVKELLKENADKNVKNRVSFL